LAYSSDIVFQASSYWQVIQTSTDPSQRFSAPFNAGNYRQAQTCYISQNTTQRNCNIITGSYQFRRNESSHDLDSQSVKVKTLITLDVPFLSTRLKLGHFAATL